MNVPLTLPTPRVIVAPLVNERDAMCDFVCICGARWEGGPLPVDVAEKFRQEFVSAHGEHTEPPSAEDLEDLLSMGEEVGA